MRRLYVAPLETVRSKAYMFSKHLTTYWMALADPSVPGWREAWLQAGEPVVVTTEFLSETALDMWQDHETVTNLPHPTFEGGMQMHEVMSQPGNVNNSVDGVEHLVIPVNIGIQLPHTIIDVHGKLARWHPHFRLRMGISG